MSLFERYGSLIQANGTSQNQRTLRALESDYVQLDERGPQALLTYLRNAAAELRYVTQTGQAIGNWSPLFEAFLDASTGAVMSDSALNALLQSKRDWQPHHALLLAVLHSYSFLQSDLNSLTARHSAYYYEELLRLARRPAVDDKVHIVFEPRPRQAPTLIEAGTALDGGKDADGNVLTYEVANDLVVSQARVDRVHRLVREVDRRGTTFFFESGEALTDIDSPWPTFGTQQLGLDESARTMAPARAGFLVVSPVLRMAEGERTIIVTLSVRRDGGLPPSQTLISAFNCSVSTADGWMSPETLQMSFTNNGMDPVTGLERPGTIEAIAVFGIDVDPIVDMATDTHGPTEALAPGIRFELKNGSGAYDTLTGMVAESVDLAVEVTGVQTFNARNDQGPQVTSKPMLPFGSQPRVGSEFILGSAEIFSKRLTRLTFNLTWKDLPDDLASHYAQYFDSTDSELEDNFRGLFPLDVDLLYRRSFEHRIVNAGALFAPGGGAEQQLIAESVVFDAVIANYAPRPEVTESAPYSTSAKYGFVRLKLRGPTGTEQALVNDSTGLLHAFSVPYAAFGHEAFGKRFARQSLALANWDGTGLEPVLPLDPYMPTLETLTLDYRASASATIGDKQADERFFTLDAWGHTVASESEPGRVVPMIDGEAILHIGLVDAEPGQIASLLFQMDPGTATAERALEQNETRWAYLAREGWKAIGAAGVLVDTTLGFQTPGIVALTTGTDAVLDHPLMPVGRVWLRATIDQAPGAASRTVTLHAQAVEARLAPTGEDIPAFLPNHEYTAGETFEAKLPGVAEAGLYRVPAHFASRSGPEFTEDEATRYEHLGSAEPPIGPELDSHLRNGLPAERISKLVDRNSAIKTVSQPFASFSGRENEADPDYFQRASERLRHRKRGVTVWDLERLVLEEFPDVYKVKCIAHYDGEDLDAAGQTTVVVVPNATRVPAMSRLEPRASTVLLTRISNVLGRDVTTPFAMLHVINPDYERVLVDARVTFRDGYDPGFYANRLNIDLQQFMSPWAFDVGQDITFGGRLFRSEVLSFMESREYVDNVTRFDLYHSHRGQRAGGIGSMEIGLDFVVAAAPEPAINDMAIEVDFVVGQGVEAAVATTPHSILVSHPAHRIEPITRADAKCDGIDAFGIGFMTVELDFEVANA